jgi:hypothetical protein
MEKRDTFLKTTNTSSEIITDMDTGEVVDVQVKTNKIIVESSKQFFYTYCKVLGIMKKLTGAEIKIISWIMGNIPFNTNKIVLTKGIKEQMSRDMGVSEASIKCSIPNLVKNKMLIKESGSRDGIYMINPDYYWKGNAQTRYKELKYVLELKYNDIKES